MAILDKVLLPASKKLEIKSETPEKMPLNPTAQGWSGQQVRKQLSKSVNMIVDELETRMVKVKEVLDDLPEHFPDVLDAPRFQISQEQPTNENVSLWFQED